MEPVLPGVPPQANAAPEESAETVVAESAWIQVTVPAEPYVMCSPMGVRVPIAAVRPSAPGDLYADLVAASSAARAIQVVPPLLERYARIMYALLGVPAIRRARVETSA